MKLSTKKDVGRNGFYGSDWTCDSPLQKLLVLVVAPWVIVVSRSL